MTSWTEPVDLVAGEASDTDALNSQVMGNLRHLRAAKMVTLGRTGDLLVPTNTWTSVNWNFATLETVEAWAVSPYPERVVPPEPGIWLVSLRIQWPPSSAGDRAVRLQANGVTSIMQETIPTFGGTMYTSITALWGFDGAGEYFNVHVWQNSGADVTVNGGHRLDAIHLGAI